MKDYDKLFSYIAPRYYRRVVVIVLLSSMLAGLWSINAQQISVCVPFMHMPAKHVHYCPSSFGQPRYVCSWIQKLYHWTSAYKDILIIDGTCKIKLFFYCNVKYDREKSKSSLQLQSWFTQSELIGLSVDQLMSCFFS